MPSQEDAAKQEAIQVDRIAQKIYHENAIKWDWTHEDYQSSCAGIVLGHARVCAVKTFVQGISTGEHYKKALDLFLKKPLW